MITYAYSSPQLLPLGERLVKAGAISTAQLKQALAAQKKSPDGPRLGHILLEQGRIDRPTLEQAVREQIQDTAFTFFSWTDGEFEFGAEESPPEEDILVEMGVETVIMEGCRRIDEWELIFEQLGSLERVPHLAHGDHVDDEGSITLTAEEWRVVVHIDGHADVNTVLHECGLDRFHGAKVIYSLFSSGLITVTEPVIETIGKGPSVAVRGPIDIYNEVFLNTLTDSNTVKQLRVELIDEKEVEIPVVAGQLPSGGNGDGGEGGGEDILVSPPPPRAPSRRGSGWPARAPPGSCWPTPTTPTAWLHARRPPVRQGLGKVPFVVATYMSMAGRRCRPSRSPRPSASRPKRRCCRAACATASRSRAWSGRRSSSRPPTAAPDDRPRVPGRRARFGNHAAARGVRFRPCTRAPYTFLTVAYAMLYTR